MDDLFSVLITIALFGFAFSNKKKKKKQEKRRAEYLERKNAVQEKPAQPRKKEAAVPFTREEWQAFLAKMDAPKASPKPAPKPAPAQPARPEPEPVLHVENDEPEGTVSTQGESHEEHARHRAEMLAAEQELLEQQETLRELRRMSTRKLRSAVVMSEVLGKPVSLRPHKLH